MKRSPIPYLIAAIVGLIAVLFFGSANATEWTPPPGTGTSQHQWQQSSAGAGSESTSAAHGYGEGGAATVTGDQVGGTRAYGLVLPAPVGPSVVPSSATPCVLTSASAQAVGWNFVSRSQSDQRVDSTCLLERQAAALEAQCKFGTAAKIRAKLAGLEAAPVDVDLNAWECQELRTPPTRVISHTQHVPVPVVINNTVTPAAVAARRPAAVAARRPVARKPATAPAPTVTICQWQQVCRVAP